MLKEQSESKKGVDGSLLMRYMRHKVIDREEKHYYYSSYETKHNKVLSKFSTTIEKYTREREGERFILESSKTKFGLTHVYSIIENKKQNKNK